MRQPEFVPNEGSQKSAFTERRYRTSKGNR